MIHTDGTPTIAHRPPDDARVVPAPMGPDYRSHEGETYDVTLRITINDPSKRWQPGFWRWQNILDTALDDTHDVYVERVKRVR